MEIEDDQPILSVADVALKHSGFLALGKLPARNHEAYYTWVWNNRPLGTGEYEYIRRQDDFVPLNGHPPGDRIIEDFIESWLDRWPFSLLNVGPKRLHSPTQRNID